MKDLPAKRRAALKAFIDSFGERKRNWVAIKADVAESTLRAFMKGKTGYLEEPTYEKLATWSRWTVAELKGETDPPTPEDIVSRKSGTQHEHGNDSERNISQDGYRTSDSPESEGTKMADRLFIEILDKIDALPPGHLHRLRLLVDRIDSAGGATGLPQSAGTAE
jgi:hypothetical protein